MARKRETFSDLDEMREDMDGLGEVLDAAAQGGASRQAEGKKEKAPRPGPKRKGNRKRLAKPLALLALALSLPAQAGNGAVGQSEAKADSLQTLRIIISSEMKAGNEVLMLKNPRLSDSLLRHPAPRETFLQGLRDSALARPVRGPEEFRAYWNRIEKENGLTALQSQMAAHDVDKGRIPKAYLFDSSVVIYPGWIILRRKPHR